ncbi:MAG: FHA domain-containing protein, partial [Gemmatimonadales bacterium]
PVPPSPSPLAAPASAAPPAAAAAAGGAGARLQHTSFGVPIPPPPPTARASAPLATFLVKTGALTGQRVPVRTPVVNVGRADYNDFMLPDESVSTTHAKLQRREGIWVLIDLDSTNGTFVDGQRITGEAPLAPGAGVRFGDVQLVFDPADDAPGVAKGGGTRLLEAMQPSAPPPVKPAPLAPPKREAAPAAAKPPKRAAASAPAAPQKKGKGCGSGAAALVLGTAALVYWILV